MAEKFMRILIMFDIPSNTKQARKNYSLWRKNLQKEGFVMLQFSVYTRICKGTTSANSHIERLKMILPPDGNIRALVLTEKQFDNMQILLGKKYINEKVNSIQQLLLF